MQKYQALAGKALALIQTTLTATQVASISHIFGTTRDNRTKAMQIMMHFRQCYGHSTMANTNPIKDEMDSLPVATDALSAEYLVAGLTFWNHCLALMEPPAPESDSSMIARLFKKLRGTMFDLVALQINELNPNFVVAISMLTRTLTLHRQRNPTRDSTYPSQTVTSAPSYQVNQQSSTSVVTSAPTYQVNAQSGVPDDTPCWNCRQNPQIAFHTRDSCKALHCANCGSSWASYSHPSFHKFTHCPLKQSQQRHQSSSSTPFVRQSNSFSNKQ